MEAGSEARISPLPPGGAAWRGRVRRWLLPGLSSWLLPWALVLAGLLNVAWPTYRHYDFSHALDTRSYLRLAAGRYDSVNVTRRYRLLLPLAAGALARPLRALGPRPIAAAPQPHQAHQARPALTSGRGGSPFICLIVWC